jgi:predicted negative regulator of RcsB-dependent stress response
LQKINYQQIQQRKKVAIYDSEEEQLEALKSWWKENGQSSLVGVALGIALIVGWNYWQAYQQEKAEQASNLYDQFMKAVAENKKDSVDKLAENMQEQFKDSEYASFSGLLQAKLKAERGDLAGAKELLKKIAADSNKELSNIAKLRLVRLMLASGEYEQGLQLISEVDPSTESSFSGNYDELTGDLLVALDRLDEARTSYEKALRSGHQSPLLKIKIDDLTAPERVEAQK